jgi:hypothetical protein
VGSGAPNTTSPSQIHLKRPMPPMIEKTMIAPVDLLRRLRSSFWRAQMELREAIERFNGRGGPPASPA